MKPNFVEETPTEYYLYWPDNWNPQAWRRPAGDGHFQRIDIRRVYLDLSEEEV